MGSHKFTCHTHTNRTCPLLPSRNASRRSAGITPTHEEMAKLSWPEWLATYRHKFLTPGIEPGHGHASFSTNRARRSVTSLMSATPLPLSQAATSHRYVCTVNSMRIRSVSVRQRSVHCVTKALWHQSGLPWWIRWTRMSWVEFLYFTPQSNSEVAYWQQLNNTTSGQSIKHIRYEVGLQLACVSADNLTTRK